jgi:hypothetical protein
MNSTVQVRVLTWLVIPAVLLAWSGCSKSELNRRKASSLIEKSEKFNPAPCGVYVSREEARNGVQDGMWTISNSMGAVALYLTPRGKQFFSGTYGALYGGSPRAVLLKPLTRHVEDVTGITDAPLNLGPAGTTKVVQFIWKWDWKALPEEVSKCGCLAPESPVSNATVLLKLYDDGWRVEAFL